MSPLFRRDSDLPKKSLWQRIKDIALLDVAVLAKGGPDPGSLEALETLLLEADFGVPTTLRLVADVEAAAKRGKVKTADEFRAALQAGILTALRAGNAEPALGRADAAPTIILVVGVNGAGKTTTIGKLAQRFRAEGRSVLVAAGDTFRAGAIDQLRVWAERTGARFVGGQPGGDSAAVAYQAIEQAELHGVDVCLIDTSGRLHTNDGLMEELRKVARVIAKRRPEAPHETLLVLDGTIGQNAVQQARAFSQAVPVTGVVVTKLDGTAKGGVVVAVHEAIDVPVKFIGVGERAQDLMPFDAAAFAEELVTA
jgi:fused signal recognition particle receptor